jgi:hypothetical protein
MDNLQLPDSFKQSYEDLESYPCNLTYQTSYPGAIQAFKERLDKAAPTLFAENDAGDINVPFRDLLPTGQGAYLPLAARLASGYADPKKSSKDRMSSTTLR